jgi:hypothetical protein
MLALGGSLLDILYFVVDLVLKYNTIQISVICIVNKFRLKIQYRIKSQKIEIISTCGGSLSFQGAVDVSG